MDNFEQYLSNKGEKLAVKALTPLMSNYQTEIDITKETQRGLVVRAKYFGISHAWGHRFRTAVSKA